jgi:hypothetical protein
VRLWGWKQAKTGSEGHDCLHDTWCLSRTRGSTFTERLLGRKRSALRKLSSRKCMWKMVIKLHASLTWAVRWDEWARSRSGLLILPRVTGLLGGPKQGWDSWLAETLICECKSPKLSSRHSYNLYLDGCYRTEFAGINGLLASRPTRPRAHYVFQGHS